MTTWFHCDDATGAIVTGGFSPTADEASLQTPPEGRSLFVVPDGLVFAPLSETPDFARLQTYLRSRIDADADAVFKVYATNITGQDRRYLKKELEALAWTEGDEIAHPERYPFMIAEAALRTQLTGVTVTVAQVRGEIIAQVAASTGPEAVIEAHRVTHKLLVSAATTLPAIVAAAQVDWAALVEAQA